MDDGGTAPRRDAGESAWATRHKETGFPDRARRCDAHHRDGMLKLARQFCMDGHCERPALLHSPVCCVCTVRARARVVLLPVRDQGIAPNSESRVPSRCVGERSAHSAARGHPPRSWQLCLVSCYCSEWRERECRVEERVVRWCARDGYQYAYEEIAEKQMHEAAP